MRKLFLFGLLCLCQFSLAAENELPSQEIEQQKTEQQDSGSQAQAEAQELETETESQQAVAGNSNDLIASEITETNEAEKETSGRFIPTEQISQDLGVSFPIDI